MGARARDPTCKRKVSEPPTFEFASAHALYASGEKQAESRHRRRGKARHRREGSGRREARSRAADLRRRQLGPRPP